MIANHTHYQHSLHSQVVAWTVDAGLRGIQRTVELGDEVRKVQHADQSEMARRLVQQLLLLLDGSHAVSNGT
jgi:hypothetical protein